jgi:hypothetical protein
MAISLGELKFMHFRCLFPVRRTTAGDNSGAGKVCRFCRLVDVPIGLIFVSRLTFVGGRGVIVPKKQLGRPSADDDAPTGAKT